ncbi:MAG: hypothetical protein LBQ57_04910 [Spirochaetales bacterium]|nr:hypothetical protein [Spirochaetales bacterium]
MGRSRGFSPFFFLQISLGVYFGVLGINGLTSYNSRGSQVLRFFGNNEVLSLLIAVILLVAGIFLVISLFAPIGGSLAPVFYIAVIIIWAIVIVMGLIVNNFLKPGLLGWLSEMSWHVAILAGTWIVSRRDF